MSSQLSSVSLKFKSIQPIILLILGLVLLLISIMFLFWSVGYMERAYVASSLMSALVGFTLLSASLYVLRLSAYVYAVEKGESRGQT